MIKYGGDGMKIRWDKKYLYWGLTALAVVAVSLCMIFVFFRWELLMAWLRRLITITTPILDGLVLAYLLTPILNWIETLLLKYVFKKRKSAEKPKYLRALSLVLTFFVVSAIVYAFCAVVLPQLFQSIQSIVRQFPAYVYNLNGWLDKVLKDNPNLEALLSQMISTYSPELREWLNTTLVPQMNQAIRIVSSYTFSILRAAWNLLIGLIISIYLMGSKERFLGQAKKMVYAFMSLERANHFIEDIRFVHRTFGGFISGKLLDSLIIGILCFIGTSIIGTPYSLLVSVIVGVTNIIPFFGPYLGAIPSAFLVLMIEPIQCLYFLIFIIILQQFDGNVLGPKILGNSTGLSGFWVIFSITLFGGFLGILGMVIGVPLFAVIYAYVRRHVKHNLKKKQLPVDTGEYIFLKRIDKDQRHEEKEESKEKG